MQENLKRYREKMDIYRAALLNMQKDKIVTANEWLSTKVFVFIEKTASWGSPTVHPGRPEGRKREERPEEISFR